MRKEAEKFIDSNLLEGYLSIRAVIWGTEQAGNTRKIETVYFAEEKREKKDREYAFLARMAQNYGFELSLVPLAQIEDMTIGNTHGGIVALCSPRDIPALTEADITENGFYIMLEGIEDPYNFGYALRSAYAAGADGVILSPRNWMTAAGVVCRASAGASERFRMYISEGDKACDFFHRRGYRVICAEKEDARPVYESNLKKPLFLIVGGEKRGISRQVLLCADALVCLEYGRDFQAALSAASAASILSFEVYRQNRT